MREIISFDKEIPFKTMINNITAISLEHTLKLDDMDEVKGNFIVSGTYKMTAASQIEEDFSYKIPVDISLNDKYDLNKLVIDIDDFTYEVINEQILKVKIDVSLDNLLVKEDIEVLNFDDQEDSREDKDDMDDWNDFDESDFEPSDKEEIKVPVEEKIKEEEPEKEIKKEEIQEKVVEENAELVDNDVRNDDLVDSKDLFLEFDDKVDLGISDVQQKEMLDISDIQNDIKFESTVATPQAKTNTEKPKENIQKENMPAIKNSDKETTESLFTSFDSSKETYATYNVYIVRENDTIDDIINRYGITKEQFDEYNVSAEIKIGSKVIIPNTIDE